MTTTLEWLEPKDWNTRVCRVTGLTPGDKMGFDAIAAVQKCGADLGEPHPDPSRECVVNGYDTGPGPDGSILVTVSYAKGDNAHSFTVVGMDDETRHAIMGMYRLFQKMLAGTSLEMFVK